MNIVLRFSFHPSGPMGHLPSRGGFGALLFLH